MGITGLIGLVDKASTSVNINQLSGSVCVIDGYGWLHKACYGCAEQLYTGQYTDQYVRYCLKRTQMIIDSGIKPIIVFDGQRLPAKELTHRNRQSIRRNIRQKIELYLSDGNTSKAKELMRNCIEVTPEMAKKLMIALREKEIDFVVSPYEADAQMSYLVNNGFADFVITEDSDLMVYKCRLCLFKLDQNGNGKLVDISLIKQCLGKDFDSTKLRHMSILSGCDYLPNLPGIGIQRAKKFFKLTANTDLESLLYKIPNYLKMSKRVKITSEYVNNFIRADNTFKYQLVFCPKLKKLLPLTPYQKGIKIEDLKYAGTYFDHSLGQEFAFQYAIGNVDTKTLKIVDSYCFEAKSGSIWSEDWFSFKKSLTTNPIVLQKSNPNKVLTVNDDINDNKVKQIINSKTTEESKPSEYFRKRLKVNENGLVNSCQLFKEYSSQTIQNKPIPSNNSTLEKSYTPYVPRNQIYSRNIFKVKTNRIEEQTIQSKYFRTTTQSESSSIKETETLKFDTLTTKQNNRKELQNLSQYSLNSSGNTAIDSSFAETITLSDSERSEISETSDEEIVYNNSYTNLKPQKNGSIKRLAPLNSTFINSSSKHKDISRYFN